MKANLWLEDVMRTLRLFVFTTVLLVSLYFWLTPESWENFPSFLSGVLSTPVGLI